jgi:hypothetical protein
MVSKHIGEFRSCAHRPIQSPTLNETFGRASGFHLGNNTG